MLADLDNRQIYRLPWTLPDNAIAWLEPTAKCNLVCEGCYRANLNQHKSLEEIGVDLDVFERYRKADASDQRSVRLHRITRWRPCGGRSLPGRGRAAPTRPPGFGL